MKLTVAHRKAFVQGVMNDIPGVDYDEQGRKIIEKRAVESLPPKVRELWDDETTRPYVIRSFTRYEGINSAYPGFKLSLTDSDKVELDRISAAKRAQTIRRRDIEAELYKAINACRTLKQARDAFPELVKHLPEESDGALKDAPVSLTQSANLLTTLSKMGYKFNARKRAST